MTLSALKAKAIKPAAKLKRYGDGGGLYLTVKPSGAKSWTLRAVINGRRTDVGLGGYPVVSLAVARQTALEYRQAIRTGRDPRQPERVIPTFRQATARYVATRGGAWRTGRTAHKWTLQLDRYAMPSLGDVPVDRINQADVLRVLELAADYPTVIAELRAKLKAIFADVMAAGDIGINPAGDVISGAAILQVRPVVRHFRALPYQDVPAALRALETVNTHASIAGAIRFAILTACRPSEARGATWAEVDIEAKVWTIPAERSKTGRPHRVPLSVQALEVLETARTSTGGRTLVFASPYRRNKPLAHTICNVVLRQATGQPVTLHGMRSAFRAWAADSGVSWDIAEQCLAHTVGSTTARAYYRGDALEHRRPVMAEWGKFVVSE